MLRRLYDWTIAWADRPGGARALFGIAFVDADRGWVGAMPRGFGTTDGGRTWTPADFGNAVNKIRLVPTKDGVVGYAIGVEIHKLVLPSSAPAAAPKPAAKPAAAVEKKGGHGHGSSGPLPAKTLAIVFVFGAQMFFDQLEARIQMGCCSCHECSSFA